MTLTLSVSYRSLLQLVGIFIAFHTRKVTIKALNESKQTGVIIYINSIFLVISGVTSFVLSRYYEVESSLTAVLSLLQPTLFLLLIFIPNVSDNYCCTSYITVICVYNILMLEYMNMSKISETRETTPTKIGFHAFHINFYLHEFFESILFFDPHGL